MKTLIKDTFANQYYCIEQTMPTADGGLTAGPNDFPYWSEDIDNAYNFGGGSLDGSITARIELECNDLTCDGTRNPIIIEIED